MRQADAQARTFLSSMLTNSMFKFHIANCHLDRTTFVCKSKRKLYFYRQEILLNLRNLKHFNIAQYNQQLETRI